MKVLMLLNFGVRTKVNLMAMPLILKPVKMVWLVIFTHHVLKGLQMKILLITGIPLLEKV